MKVEEAFARSFMPRAVLSCPIHGTDIGNTSDNKFCGRQVRLCTTCRAYMTYTGRVPKCDNCNTDLTNAKQAKCGERLV